MRQQSRYVIRWARLLCDASSQESEQCPAHEGNRGRREEVSNTYEGKSRNNEDEFADKNSRGEKGRRDVRKHSWMQAERDAAGKSYDNRNGWQLHGAFRSLTSVSM